MMQANPASFRDPSGHVYEDSGNIYRTVAPAYAGEWDALEKSGLLDSPNIIPFEKLDKIPDGIPGSPAAVLRSPRLPFISYPYEWSFDQLRNAACLTLDLHACALEKGFILKDASAYNVQFWKGKPVFIDLQSFEPWKEGQPWQAYGQFCQHFLAPLALMAKKDARLGRLSQDFIDGIPLDLASALLPAASKFSPALYLHIHMHASMRAKHADARAAAEKVKKVRMSRQKMLDMVQSLRDALSGLKFPQKDTEWGDYYQDTNYTGAGRADKAAKTKAFASRHAGGKALDLGANNGEYSRLLVPFFEFVIAADGDPAAVNEHWTKERLPDILPLLLDAANPSPAIGWANAERASFTERCKVNFLMALALVHHLRFTFGIPPCKIASWFQELLAPGGHALVEFVPKTDSQVQRLLASRDDVFEDYSEDNFIGSFHSAGFKLLESSPIIDSQRRLHLFQKI